MRSSGPRNEAELEKLCVGYAAAYSCLSVKLDKSARSWPDRIFFLPENQHLLVEFKRPGQKARPQQTARHESLAELGHTVSVIDNYADFTSLLSALLAR